MRKIEFSRHRLWSARLKIRKYLSLRFRKAGRVWCGGARETHWATGDSYQNQGVSQITPFFLDLNGRKISKIYTKNFWYTPTSIGSVTRSSIWEVIGQIRFLHHNLIIMILWLSQISTVWSKIQNIKFHEKNAKTNA